MELKIKLTKEQQKYYDSIKWLTALGPLRCGKTTLLAYCLAEHAMHNLGNWIFVFDHNPEIRENWNSNILYQISNIIPDELRMEINGQYFKLENKVRELDKKE